MKQPRKRVRNLPASFPRSALWREPLEGASTAGAKGGPPPSRPKDARKKSRERAGRRAEDWAALWLQAKGYRIRARRFKTPLGEIDLIATRGRTLAFVEVKGRARRAAAAESIHAANQSRVVRAAQWWLAAHPTFADYQVRFDACLVAWYRWPHHLPHAFSAS